MLRPNNKKPLPNPSISGFETIKRYWDHKQQLVTAKILPGEYYVTDENELISTVLGSCISACIRDKVTGIGGMNHFMLPQTTQERLDSANEDVVGLATRYGNFAMEHLINTILTHGGKRENLQVKVFGGGKINPSMGDVGATNVDFILHYIAAERMEFLSQDLGDIYPRKIIYFPRSGRVKMKKIKHMHNDAIMQREINYRTNIKQEKVEDDIELF